MYVYPPWQYKGIDIIDGECIYSRQHTANLRTFLQLIVFVHIYLSLSLLQTLFL